MLLRFSPSQPRLQEHFNFFHLWFVKREKILNYLIKGDLTFVSSLLIFNKCLQLLLDNIFHIKKCNLISGLKAFSMTVRHDLLSNVSFFLFQKITYFFIVIMKISNVTYTVHYSNTCYSTFLTFNNSPYENRCTQNLMECILKGVHIFCYCNFSFR